MSGRTLRQIRMVLPMEPDREVEAGDTASRLAESVHMDPDRIDELRMAVHEAFINASEHSQASDGRVYVTFRLLGEQEPETIEVVVRDTGVGFSTEAVRGTIRKAPQGRPRKRGWGLTIMRRLMDEVEIQSGSEGTVVVMSKRIAPAS
ncbi:MAG TPA: ATP-binding protein [Thermoanaerobaculia bacterium]|nr:ATP-binding protein [Thermoanaerobaculia bacterium]